MKTETEKTTIWEFWSCKKKEMTGQSRARSAVQDRLHFRIEGEKTWERS